MAPGPVPREPYRTLPLSVKANGVQGERIIISPAHRTTTLPGGVKIVSGSDGKVRISPPRNTGAPLPNGMGNSPPGNLGNSPPNPNGMGSSPPGNGRMTLPRNAANISTLNTSSHNPSTSRIIPPHVLSATTGGSGGGSVSPGHSGSTGVSNHTRITPLDQSRDQSSHATDVSHLSHLSHLSALHPGDISRISRGTNKLSPSFANLIPKWTITPNLRPGSKGALTSLGLLCLTSLLLALLALTFLVELDLDFARVKSFPDPDRFGHGEDSTVREVTLALAAITLCLDLCCLLVCSAQFIFALKLVKNDPGEQRLTLYLHQLSYSRVFAIGAFFISIPIFLTAVILFTFGHFQRTPAILTAILISVGILICGIAMIHNVYVWQKEKSKSYAGSTTNQNRPKILRQSQNLRSNSSPLPNATLDLSNSSRPAHELSTLV